MITAAEGCPLLWFPRSIAAKLSVIEMVGVIQWSFMSLMLRLRRPAWRSVDFFFLIWFAGMTCWRRYSTFNPATPRWKTRRRSRAKESFNSFAWLAILPDTVRFPLTACQSRRARWCCASSAMTTTLTAPFPFGAHYRGRVSPPRGPGERCCEPSPPSSVRI